MQGMGNGYDGHFFENLQKSQVPSAAAIAPFLFEVLQPRSAIDIGCGRGFWLLELSRLGVERIYGMDGPWAPVDKLAFPSEKFQSCDLNSSIRLNESFDLALSLEVAEHLAPERASSFVNDLCALAPAVFFSAAVPGQGGTHHYNEQWPSYWAKLFEKNDFIAYDIVRPRFWNDENITWWYKQNTTLYVHKDKTPELEGLKPYRHCTPDELQSLIHPTLYNQKIRAANPGFGKWIRSGKKALIKSIKNRV